MLYVTILRARRGVLLAVQPTIKANMTMAGFAMSAFAAYRNPDRSDSHTMPFTRLEPVTGEPLGE